MIKKHVEGTLCYALLVQHGTSPAHEGSGCWGSTAWAVHRGETESSSLSRGTEISALLLPPGCWSERELCLLQVCSSSIYLLTGTRDELVLPWLFPAGSPSRPHLPPPRGARGRTPPFHTAVCPTDTHFHVNRCRATRVPLSTSPNTCRCGPCSNDPGSSRATSHKGCFRPQSHNACEHHGLGRSTVHHPSHVACSHKMAML